MTRSPFERSIRYYLEDGLNEIGLGLVLLGAGACAATAALAGAEAPEWAPGILLLAGVAALGPIVRRRKERRFARGGYVEWGPGGVRPVLLGLAVGAALVVTDVVLGEAGGVVPGLGVSVALVTLVVAYWTGLRRYAVLGVLSLGLFVAVLSLEPGLVRFAAFATGLGGATLGSGTLAARRGGGRAHGAVADA